MSTLTALLLILFGFALAVSILLWAAVRPKPRTENTPNNAPKKPASRPAAEKQPKQPATPAERPAVRLRPNRLAPPPAKKTVEQESDAFKRFLQPDD